MTIDGLSPADADGNLRMVVRDYATRYGLTYPIGLDVTGAVFRTYRIFGLPSHYFIDRDGIIRSRYFGPLTRDQIEQQLTTILAP